jgi:hypothetical protein
VSRHQLFPLAGNDVEGYREAIPVHLEAHQPTYPVTPKAIEASCIGPGGNDYGEARRLTILDPSPDGPRRALIPSPARDVPRIDPATADVARLATFMWDHIRPHLPAYHYRLRSDFGAEETARAMVRDFDQLEEILGELLTKGGRV